MTGCEVLDLQDKKWRFVTTRPLDHHHILTNQRPAFANGSFYWLTGDDEEGYPSTQTKLILFDIHTEMFQLVPTPPFITLDASPETIGLCNLDGRLCISELKGDDCKQEFWWSVKDNTKWEKIFTVDLRSTSTWFRGITSQPLTPLAISRDNNKVILSLRDQDNLVAFDLDPDSAIYHLYFSGYYGLAVPYFPKCLRMQMALLGLEVNSHNMALNGWMFQVFPSYYLKYFLPLISNVYDWRRMELNCLSMVVVRPLHFIPSKQDYLFCSRLNFLHAQTCKVYRYSNKPTDWK
ncbi:unnamed protein product [Arabis nemorensis]|uniref:F-box associated beta-propeller type 1 domain-containing protein n=1 Tax=Arabis nemorensis TaxID=586526 RepID=A0A565BU28_9BRAS|nr:unnamed protein product [Arabis nemorensis]